MNIINSYNPEFGYELISVLPYAYWLYKQRRLKKTISAKDTECLYYFSPKHEINPEQRSWYSGKTASIILLNDEGVPNAFIHKSNLDLSRFSPPPYKKAYKNNWAVFEKPTFVIYNRYNNEWPAGLNEPINFFSLEILEVLFNKLKDKYSVLYCNIHGQPDLYDNAPPIEIEDRELCERLRVTHVMDLQEKHPGLSYNQILLYYFSNCKLFLTMNGGGSILASYFGGKNIIYSKQSKELITGDFGYYHLFGGSEIKVVNTYDEILKNL
jgi:hypothetical protein